MVVIFPSKVNVAIVNGDFDEQKTSLYFREKPRFGIIFKFYHKNQSEAQGMGAWGVGTVILRERRGDARTSGCYGQ